MIKSLIYFSPILCLMLASCEPPSLNGDIYNAGFIINNGRTACYWVGNRRIDLVSSLQGQAYINDITVKDSIVYTCGSFFNNGKLNGFYSIDNSIIYLDNEFISEITSIDVIRDTIHFVGYYNDMPAHWKNGELEFLENNDQYFVESIYGFNNEIFISGFNRKSKSICLWINGVRLDVNDGVSTYESGNNLFVDKYDTLISGTFLKNGFVDKACYWKNGKRIELSNNLPFFSYGTSIYKFGNDIYVTGYFGKIDENKPGFTKIRQACYWKNGELVELEGENTIANSIKVVEDKILVGGSSMQNDLTPCYWVNGMKFDLESGFGKSKGKSKALDIL